MSSFRSPVLDKSATIRACTQLSKICEVILVRLSRREIEKYTRSKVAATISTSVQGQSNNQPSDGRVKRRCGRPRKYENFLPTKKIDRPRKYEHLSNKEGYISSNSNCELVSRSVEFVDCSLKEGQLNTRTDCSKLETPLFVEDKVHNKQLDNLVNCNTGNRHGNSTDGKKKRKSVRFADEKEECKRIRLDVNGKSNSSETCRKSILTSRTLEDRERGLCYNKDKMKPVPAYKQDRSDNGLPIKMPMPIKLESVKAETVINSYSDSGSDKLVHISNTDYYASNEDLQYDVGRQLEYSQVGHETTTEMCVSIGGGSMYSENFNEPISDTFCTPTVESQNDSCSNIIMLNAFSLGDALHNQETVITHRERNEINKPEVSKNTEFNTSTCSNVYQVVSPIGKMEMPDEDCATDGNTIISGNGVAGSDAGGYFSSNPIKQSEKMLLNPEKNNTLALSTLDKDNCIIIDDDDDDDNDNEVINLTDSEEIIDCDDDDDIEEILPVSGNDNVSEEKSSSSQLELEEENTRCSLDSNTSEELMDFATHTGDIVIFDNINNFYFDNDKKSTKTSVEQNNLYLDKTICVNRDDADTTDSGEVIIFDDINSVELNNLGDCMSKGENQSHSVLKTLLVQNGKDIEYNKVQNNSDSSSYKGTTGSDSKSTADREEDQSLKAVHVGKIRVKDPLNLGIVSYNQYDNSNTSTLCDKVTSEHVSETVSTEISFISADCETAMESVTSTNSSITQIVEKKQKLFCSIYMKYFDMDTEEIIKEMSRILHVAVYDKLNYMKNVEQVEKLLTEDTIIVEKTRAQMLYKSNLMTSGLKFMKFLKKFVQKVNIRVLQYTVFIMVCRVVDYFLRIDSGNKKHFCVAYDELREMLISVNCVKFYKLDRIVYMDMREFIKKYNTVIILVSKILQHIKSNFNEDGTRSNVQVKQPTTVEHIQLKNTGLQEKPVVTIDPLDNGSTLVVTTKSTLELVDKRKNTATGILLLNGKNMGKVSDLSLRELVKLNKHVYLEPIKKSFSFLYHYRKYFLGTTEDKLLRLGELLHIITCEMLCKKTKLESIENLPPCSLKVCEEATILATYKYNLEQRGLEFIQLMKGITNKFHASCFKSMIRAMYCRITEIFLKIDIKNINYFIIIRDVVKDMCVLNNYTDVDLFELLTMKEEAFVRSYNSVINVLVTYYDMEKFAESRDSMSSKGDSNVTYPDDSNNETSVSKIIVPLDNVENVTVPVRKRHCDDSVLIDGLRTK